MDNINNRGRKSPTLLGELDGARPRGTVAGHSREEQSDQRGSHHRQEQNPSERTSPWHDRLESAAPVSSVQPTLVYQSPGSSSHGTPSISFSLRGLPSARFASLSDMQPNWQATAIEAGNKAGIEIGNRLGMEVGTAAGKDRGSVIGIELGMVYGQTSVSETEAVRQVKKNGLERFNSESNVNAVLKAATMVTSGDILVNIQQFGGELATRAQLSNRNLESAFQLGANQAMVSAFIPAIRAGKIAAETSGRETVLRVGEIEARKNAKLIRAHLPIFARIYWSAPQARKGFLPKNLLSPLGAGHPVRLEPQISSQDSPRTDREINFAKHWCGCLEDDRRKGRSTRHSQEFLALNKADLQTWRDYMMFANNFLNEILVGNVAVQYSVPPNQDTRIQFYDAKRNLFMVAVSDRGDVFPITLYRPKASDMTQEDLAVLRPFGRGHSKYANWPVYQS